MGKIFKKLFIGAFCLLAVVGLTGCNTEGLSSDQVDTMMTTLEKSQTFMSNVNDSLDDQIDQDKEYVKELKRQNDLKEEEIAELKRNNDNYSQMLEAALNAASIEQASKIELVELVGIEDGFYIKVGNDLDLSNAYAKIYSGEDPDQYRIYPLGVYGTTFGFDSSTAGHKEMFVIVEGTAIKLDYYVFDNSYLLNYLIENLSKQDTLIVENKVFDFANNRAYSKQYYTHIYEKWYEQIDNTILEYEKDYDITSGETSYTLYAGSNVHSLAEEILSNLLYRFNEGSYSGTGAAGPYERSWTFALLDNNTIKIIEKLEMAYEDYSDNNYFTDYTIENGLLTTYTKVSRYYGNTTVNLVYNEPVEIPDRPTDVEWNVDEAYNAIVYDLLIGNMISVSENFAQEVHFNYGFGEGVDTYISTQTYDYDGTKERWKEDVGYGYEKIYVHSINNPTDDTDDTYTWYYYDTRNTTFASVSYEEFLEVNGSVRFVVEDLHNWTMFCRTEQDGIYIVNTIVVKDGMPYSILSVMSNISFDDAGENGQYQNSIYIYEDITIPERPTNVEWTYDNSIS